MTDQVNIGSIQIARPVREQLFARTAVLENNCSRKQLFSRTVVTRAVSRWPDPFANSCSLKQLFARTAVLENNCSRKQRNSCSREQLLPDHMTAQNVNQAVHIIASTVGSDHCNWKLIILHQKRTAYVPHLNHNQ